MSKESPEILNKKENIAIFFIGASGTSLPETEFERNLKTKYKEVTILGSSLSLEKVPINRSEILVRQILSRLENDEKITFYTHSFSIQEFHDFYKLLLQTAEKVDLVEKIFENIDLILISPFGLGDGIKNLTNSFARMMRLFYTQASLAEPTKGLIKSHYEHGIASLSFLPLRNIDNQFLSATLSKFIPNYFEQMPQPGMRVVQSYKDDEGIYKKMDKEKIEELYERVYYVDLIIRRLALSLSSDTLNKAVRFQKINLLKKQLSERATLLSKEMNSAFSGNNPKLFNQSSEEINQFEKANFKELVGQVSISLGKFILRGFMGNVTNDLSIWRKKGLKMKVSILEYDVIASFEELKKQLDVSEEEVLELFTFYLSAIHASFVLNPDNTL